MWWTRNAWDLCASFFAFRALCIPAAGAGLGRPRRQGAERAVPLSALQRCSRNRGEPAAVVAGPPPRPVPRPTVLKETSRRLLQREMKDLLDREATSGPAN